MPKPTAEIEIDEQLAQALISEQFPELAHNKIQFVASGWDNTNFKLGTDYVLRIPRRAIGAELLEKEIHWLSRLKPLLPIPIPAVVHIGKPTSHIPWNWAIYPWYNGATADLEPLASKEALRLIGFLQVLHQNQPNPGPINPFRSMPLAEKADDTIKRVEAIEAKEPIYSSKLLEIWERALATPVVDSPCLIHGDLHPLNIITKENTIAAIVDWGDLCLGDPATDLASLWILFADRAVRQEALTHYGATEHLIARAKGWAFFCSTVLLETGLEDEKYWGIGKRIVNNLA